MAWRSVVTRCLPWRRTCLSLVCACLGSVAVHASEVPAGPHVVQAAHYGDVLFHFYQDDYFNAISSLMVSQHFQRLAPHDDEAEVLRGGLLLSWGMHQQAGEVFERLIAQGTAPSVRDRAWYFLAKVRHTRELHEAAQDALNHIEGTLPPDLEAERGLLTAQVKLALGDPAGAAQALNTLAGTRDAKTQATELLGDATRYARFNLGVALVRGGDSAQGQVWLDDLGRSRAATEEQRSLRDQANLALGFAALQRENADTARLSLERVRLVGPFSNKALLGFGWAALAKKQPALALVPWQELLTRDASDPAVQEARIALPYALAELGAQAEALGQYQTALEEYKQESGRLDESIAALRSGPWLTQLLAMNPGAGLGWSVKLDDLPALPHGRQLASTLAGHPFQEGFKVLRDLQFLATHLREWQEKLAGYSDMLALRQQAFAKRLPGVRQQAQQIDLAGLQARQQALAAELDAARAQGDGVALATPHERELLQRLARAHATLGAATTAPAAPDDDARTLAQAGERLRLLAGLLSWDLAQAAPERLWQATKAIQGLDEQRAKAQERLAALDQAQRDEAQRFTAFGQRIAALNQQIQQLLPQLDRVGQQQAARLQTLAVADLQTQKERLAAYGTTARYAMAQLQDSARPTLQDEHAAPR